MTKSQANQVKWSLKQKGVKKKSVWKSQKTLASPKSKMLKKIKMKGKPKKVKWAKFKRWTQIEDIAKHERQPKWFSMKCNPWV